METESSESDKYNRSRVTNGKLFDRSIDGRSSRARRFRDLHRAIVGALARPLNVIEQGLVRNIASGMALLEEWQAQFMAGEKIDVDGFTRLNGALLRQARLLGLTPIKGPDANTPPDPLAAWHPADDLARQILDDGEDDDDPPRNGSMRRR
jgi:hypothetical protein